MANQVAIDSSIKGSMRSNMAPMGAYIDDPSALVRSPGQIPNLKQAGGYQMQNNIFPLNDQSTDNLGLPSRSYNHQNMQAAGVRNSLSGGGVFG